MNISKRKVKLFVSDEVIIKKLMMKKIKSCLFVLSLLFIGGCTKSNEVSYTSYVNTFIGTQGEGHCFPGATVPMGMVQLSPESYSAYYYQYENSRVAGYQYNDSCLIGFTHTHLSGAGCPTLSDILLTPYCKKKSNGQIRSDFRSTYDKKTEIAQPGYYHVYLNDNHVDVSLTATAHIGFHQYKFDEVSSARLLVDLQYGVKWDNSKMYENIIEAQQQFEDPYTLTGYRYANEWTRRKLFYVIKFSHKVKKIEELPSPANKANKKEKAPRYILSFDMKGQNKLDVKVALSTTSIEGAKKNMLTESKDNDSFNEVRNDAHMQWEKLLAQVKVQGDKDKMVQFYTSLYHLYIQPNNLADVDGRYRAENDSLYTARSGQFYSTFSLWDTYRAAHPMYTILTPSKVALLGASLLDSYYHKETDPNNPGEANPYLPVWGLWGHETNTMIANHAITVLVDAWLKGIHPKGYSDDELYEALWVTQTKAHAENHVDVINKFGYIPMDYKMSSIDDNSETVSRLLEGTLDYYAVAQMAKRLNKKKNYTYLMERADMYRNVYDADFGFMHGRYANGKFRKDTKLDFVVGGWVNLSDYTEGNSWHYLFHVQHDISGLHQIMGDKLFRNRLDSMFYAKSNPILTPKDTVTGCLGQYWHGNEPCHHVPYLYKYTDQGYKTDAIINYIINNFTLNKPDGLQGNDDCGQMSAWYMFATLGFYPVNPCGGEYILGAPQFQKSQIKLENGKTFTVLAHNISKENIFVKEIKLNGKKMKGLSITHMQIMSGGTLEFFMTNRKDKNLLQTFHIN